MQAIQIVQYQSLIKSVYNDFPLSRIIYLQIVDISMYTKNQQLPLERRRKKVKYRAPSDRRKVSRVFTLEKHTYCRVASSQIASVFRIMREISRNPGHRNDRACGETLFLSCELTREREMDGPCNLVEGFYAHSTDSSSAVWSVQVRRDSREVCVDWARSGSLLSAGLRREKDFYFSASGFSNIYWERVKRISARFFKHSRNFTILYIPIPNNSVPRLKL